ncbi:retinal-binding protein-like [Argiope bruennichi]|uniref:SEC14-like protein 4 like protein n=1 Tax=Argiope bruennichi TaxID=94029 RepID=A0A8T0G0X3_ARGBR|nr:retinal-binding protein-like [Argiope bruennichi]KAF8794823.1 SEC14-like protein 4 like protein [Argiope bruennichi]
MTESWESDLAATEKEALDQLKERLSADMIKQLHDDTYHIYMFLKDSNFDVDQAENVLIEALKWRKKLNVDAIGSFDPPEIVKIYTRNHRMGCDKNGSIIHYVPLGKLDVKGIHMSIKYSDLEKTLIKELEKDMRLLKEKRTSPNGPFPNVSLILDMEGLSFANATDKKGLEYLIRSLRITQNYYPGLIKGAYIINISGYFMIPCNIVKSCLSAAYVERAKFFGSDGWKEELLKVIDADQLPAFLGGNKTDPDGNPLCINSVMQGGKINEKYYIHKSKNPLSSASDVKKIVLARASFSEIELEVEEDGSLIEWEFETKTRDIGFGLFYKEIVDGEEKITELVPLLRIDTEDYAETGVYKCEKAGTYVILFDNSYSWLRSKEVFYRIKTINPREHEKQVQG